MHQRPRMRSKLLSYTANNKSSPLPYVRAFSGSTFATLIPPLSSYVHLLDRFSLYSHNSLFVAMTCHGQGRTRTSNVSYVTDLQSAVFSHSTHLTASFCGCPQNDCVPLLEILIKDQFLSESLCGRNLQNPAQYLFGFHSQG